MYSYSRRGRPFTQQGVRAKEQVNLSIEVPLVPQVPFRGTSSYRAHTSKRYLVPSCCMVGVGWMTCPTTTTTAVKFHFFALDDAPENVAWCHDDAPSKFQLLTPTLECSASHLPGRAKKCGWWVGGGSLLHVCIIQPTPTTAAWYLGTSSYRARTSKRYLRYLWYL